MKLMILVTHLLGIGHLNRAAALGRAFARAGHDVVLVSGGRPAPTVDMGGIRLVQLPPVHIQGTDFKTLFQDNGQGVDSVLLAERTKILQETIHNFAPDSLITELYPFGRRQLSAEFDAAIAALEALGDVRPVFASVRDVLAPPSTDRKRQFADDVLAQHYQAVLVHGDADVLPLSASWPVSPGLQRMLRTTGYVREAAAPPAGGSSGEILVSGGGSDAALPLQRTAIAAASRDPGRRWRILVGYGVTDDEFAQLQASQAANTVVERVRKDFGQLLADCACSISLGGYNTMLDLAATGVPAVIVPFDAGGEVEQGIRAAMFARRGLATVLPSAELGADRLLAAVAEAMARGRTGPVLAMDGARESVAIVTAEYRAAQAVAEAWRGMTVALDRAAARGISVPFWWRDDDAVAPTAALDRLLALANAYRVPLALAVIPDTVTETLGERLASEPFIEVLVHGIAHRNNAPAGAKKQELVAAHDETITALTNGRARLVAMFGAQALPVLVPPWNRIAPELVRRLPELDFAGLSTFGPETTHTGLAVLNTHIDPIDWKGGGGLSGAVAHIQRTTALIDAVVAGERVGAIGLLTHHLVHDAWIWAFVEQWIKTVSSHPAGHFRTARNGFGLTSAGGRAPKEGEARM